ncbi:hypothetical protein FRB90_012515, partial [Tulasnella sp. 427]
AKSQANAGSESNHGSPTRELHSPSREPEGASTGPVSVDHEEKPSISTASFEGADEEEDIKPDITALQSNPSISTKVPDVPLQPIGSVPDSNRTSPGLPLADFTKTTRRSFSSSSSKKAPNPAAVPDADAMDIDLPVTESTGSRRSTLGSGPAPLAADASLDLLAQLASTAIKRDPSASTEPEDAAQAEGDAASSAAGDDLADDPDRLPGDGDPEEDDTREDAEEPSKENGDEGDDDEGEENPPSRQSAIDDAQEDEEEDEQEQAVESDHDSEVDTLQKPKIVDGESEMGPDEEPEMEAEIENEIQPTQRAEALELLAAMELKHALLRERIYLDRMRFIAREENQPQIAHKGVLGTHPEYLHLLSELQRRRDRKLDLASIRLEKEREFASHKRKMEENAVWGWWNETRDVVRDDIVAENNSKRRRLEREKRALDYPRITRPSPVMPNPQPVRTPGSPKSLRAAIKTQTHRHSSPTIGQPKAAPTLAPLSKDELTQDLDLITGRARRQSANVALPPPPPHSGPPPAPYPAGPQQQPHPQSHPPYPPQPSYGPAPGYGPPPQPGAPRYGPPIGYGHPADPAAGPYPPHPQQHAPQPYPEQGYEMYPSGLPPAHQYPPGPPPNHPQYAPPPQQSPYPPPPGQGPPPPHPQHAPPQHYPPQPQPLHQPQPQPYPYRLPGQDPSPPPAIGGYPPRNAWPPPGPTPKSAAGPKENGSGSRPHTVHPKQEPPPPERLLRDDRPASSSGRSGPSSMHPPLEQPQPGLPRTLPPPTSSTTTPRPPSTLPPPGSASRSSHQPLIGSPPSVLPPPQSYSSLPPRSTATPLSSAPIRHSQSPQQRRAPTPHGPLPPFGTILNGASSVAGSTSERGP